VCYRISGGSRIKAGEAGFLSINKADPSSFAKTLGTILMFVFILFAPALQAEAFRCGTDVINVGDTGFQLIRKCGEPIQRIHVGYTLTKDGKREYVVEKWIYGPSGGFYHEVTLEGDRITKIDMVR